MDCIHCTTREVSDVCFDMVFLTVTLHHSFFYIFSEVEMTYTSVPTQRPNLIPPLSCYLELYLIELYLSFYKYHPFDMHGLLTVPGFVPRTGDLYRDWLGKGQSQLRLLAPQ